MGDHMSAVMHDRLPRYRITVDEYHRLGELGFFAPDARVELIDGQRCELHTSCRPAEDGYAETSSTASPGIMPIRALSGASADLSGLFVF